MLNNCNCSFPGSFDVSPCENLMAAVRTILANAREKNERQTLPSDSEERIFEVVERLSVCPEQMFKYLIKTFVEIYDIDLIIIANKDGKFDQINTEAQEPSLRKAKIAFLLFNKDYTVRGPLFMNNADGSIRTAFLLDDYLAKVDLYMYLLYLNDPGESFQCNLPLKKDSCSLRMIERNVQIVQSQGLPCAGEMTQTDQSRKIFLLFEMMISNDTSRPVYQ
jgi:hypothetical protein